MSSFVSDGSSGAVRVVCQRVCSAELLLDGDNEWAKMEHGLIVYISFSKKATREILPRVAKAVANFNIVTRGNWGDGTQPMSARQLVAEQKEPCGVMVIPQAGLCAKIKGKTLQYREQCTRDLGMELYGEFCHLLKREICTAASRKNAGTSGKETMSVGPHVPPKNMFLGGQFSSWSEDTGLPTRMMNGEPVSKSKLKKLVKLQKAQEKRYMAYLENPDQYLKSVDEVSKAKAGAATAAGSDSEGSEYLTFICGTFGNRQGLRVDASCGPFSHAFAFGVAN